MKNLFNKQSEKLTAAYSVTIYRCLDPALDLNISKGNEELDHYLKQGEYDKLCILTAYNPESVIQSVSDNQQSQDHLVIEIEEDGLYWREGVNKDPHMKFPDEKTCWVLGMTREDGIQYAKRWAQNAFVFYTVGEHPELIWVNS